MISQVLPHLISATAMVRVSEFGAYTDVEGEDLEIQRREPLSGIFPEAFELSLSEGISLTALLYFLSYACFKHRAFLEVNGMSADPLPSAVVSIVTSHGYFQAITVIRKKSVLFILPAPSSVSSAPSS